MTKDEVLKMLGEVKAKKSKDNNNPSSMSSDSKPSSIENPSNENKPSRDTKPSNSNKPSSIPSSEPKTKKDKEPKYPNLEDYDKDFTPTEDSKESNVLEFSDAGDFLSFADPEIAEGRVTPYKWQYDQLSELSDNNISAENPYLLAMPAANGSGKDKYIIAPFAVWMLCCKYKARTIITTSSGTQLTRQTEPYITQLCRKVNEIFPDFIKIRQRHMTCAKTGSEIVMFATDEGGQAEGYHPWESNTPMALIVNEAKSVLPEIFQAIERCTGYTHELLISSPGPDSGDFYKAYTSGLFKTRKITAFDCPHIKPRDIEKTKILYGEGSPLYKSKVLAEFTSLGTLTVIPREQYDRCLKVGKEFGMTKIPRRAGLDLAAGGDETVLSIWQGNKQIALEAFYTPDTVDGVDMIVRRLEHWELEADNVYADDGGIGKSIIDQIWRRKRFKGGWWTINRVLNQSSAINSKDYGNRGAELYFNFQRLVQECLIVPMVDDKQTRQLTTRKYKQGAVIGKLVLQSKAEARAEGMESPDRGDAAVLAQCGLTVLDFLEIAPKDIGKKYAYTIILPEEKPVIYTNPYEDYDKPAETNRCYGSLRRLLEI